MESENAVSRLHYFQETMELLDCQLDERKNSFVIVDSTSSGVLHSFENQRDSSLTEKTEKQFLKLKKFSTNESLLLEFFPEEKQTICSAPGLFFMNTGNTVYLNI